MRCTCPRIDHLVQRFLWSRTRNPKVAAVSEHYSSSRFFALTSAVNSKRKLVFQAGSNISAGNEQVIRFLLPVALRAAANPRRFQSGALPLEDHHVSQPPVGLEFARHFSVKEIAQQWGLSRNAVIKMFRGQPGVFVLGHEGAIQAGLHDVTYPRVDCPQGSRAAQERGVPPNAVNSRSIPAAGGGGKGT